MPIAEIKALGDFSTDVVFYKLLLYSAFCNWNFIYKYFNKSWREHYNNIRLHSSLYFAPPVLEVTPSAGSQCLRMRLT